MILWNGMNRRELFVKYGPASVFLLAALRAERGLALNRKGRYVLVHTGAGYSMPDISPTGDAGTSALTDALFAGKNCQPLAAHKDNLIILRGVGIGPDNTDFIGGDSHDSGTVWLATGAKTTNDGSGKGSYSGNYATCASFDEIIARRRGQGSIINSQIAYNHNVNRPSGRHSYNSAGQAINPSQSPRDIFRSVFGADGNRLFSNCGAGVTPVPTSIPAGTTDFQKSRMDANLSEFNSLINSPRLSSAEKDLLKKMMEQLRALETDTTAPIGGGAPPMTATDQISPFCNRMRDTKYAGDGGGKSPSATEVAAVASQIFDIVTLALVLDITDSATISFIPGGTNSHGYVGLPYTLNGTNYKTDASAEPHAYSHFKDGAEKRAKVGAIDTFHAQQVALLATRLKSFSLGAGTLLDETVIQWASELSDGDRHNNSNTPIFLVGGKRLESMPTGKLMVFNNKPSNVRVYTALAKRMDLKETDVSTNESRKPALF